MSEDNVESARRCWAAMVEAGRALRAGDTDRDTLMDEVWDPEAEYQEDPSWPDAGIYKGRDAVTGRFEEYLALLGTEGIDITVEKIIDAGDEIVSIVLVHSQSSRSGASWEQRWGYVGRMREGRWLALRAYYDPSEALKAAGLEG